jgi:hypothetical protein
MVFVWYIVLQMQYSNLVYAIEDEELAVDGGWSQWFDGPYNGWSSSSSNWGNTPPVVPATPPGNPGSNPWWSQNPAWPRLWDGGLLNQKTEVLPNVPWTGKWLGTTDVISVGERVMNTIKNTINRFLWLLALIALVLIIWAWFKILIWQDDDYEQAKTTLKNAFFGIVMIGISWLIVTFLFYVVCVVTEWEYCTSSGAWSNDDQPIQWSDPLTDTQSPWNWWWPWDMWNWNPDPLPGGANDEPMQWSNSNTDTQSPWNWWWPWGVWDRSPNPNPGGGNGSPSEWSDSNVDTQW